MLAATTTIEIKSLGGFGIVFYGLIVMAGCVGFAVLYYNWLRDNAFEGEHERLHGVLATLLAIGLFVAFAFVAEPK